MIKVLKFFENHFGILGILGLFLGLTFADYLTFLGANFLTGLLLMMLFLSVLKTDFGELRNSFKKPGMIFLLVIVKMFILPLAAFYLSYFLELDQRMGLMLVAAVPAAVASPGIVAMLRGNIELTLIVSVVTNLIAPFVIPFLFFYTVGAEIEFEVLDMLLFLLFMVGVPFVCGVSMEKYFPKKVEKVNEYSGGILGLIMFLFVFAVIAPYKNLILENPWKSLSFLGLAFIASLTFHLVGFLLGVKSGKKMLPTSIVIMAYANVGLGILIAFKYFSPTTTLILVMYEFFWIFGLMPMQYIFAKRKS